MFGAVIGDIIGSTIEFSHIKTKDFTLFPRGSEFTDDSILTIAVGDAATIGYFINEWRESLCVK